MDLQDLKNVWDKEAVEKTPEISLDAKNLLSLPLEKIRSNMKMEFYTTMVAFVAIIFYFSVSDLFVDRLKVYVITLVLTMIMIAAFYFIKFFRFYNSLTTVDLTVLDNLKEIQFEFRLNEQYYYSYYIAFIPILIAEIFLVFEFSDFYKQFSDINFIFLFVGSCLFGLIFLYITARIWFKYFYGKYFTLINEMIKELY